MNKIAFFFCFFGILGQLYAEEISSSAWTSSDDHSQAYDIASAVLTGGLMKSDCADKEELKIFLINLEKKKADIVASIIEHNTVANRARIYSTQGRIFKMRNGKKLHISLPDLLGKTTRAFLFNRSEELIASCVFERVGSASSSSSDDEK